MSHQSSFLPIELQISVTWAVAMQIVQATDITPQFQAWMRQFLPIELMRAHGFIDDAGETDKLRAAAEFALTNAGGCLSDDQRHKLAQTMLYMATMDGIPSGPVSATVLRAIAAIGFDAAEYADAFTQ